MVSIADTRAFFPSRDISVLRDSASLRVILGYRGLKWNTSRGDGGSVLSIDFQVTYPSPIRCDRKRNVDHENNSIIRENDRFFVEFEIRV